MHAYYIRHTETLGVKRDALREFWKQHKIIIHSATNSDSTDPADYTKGEKTAMKRMCELAEYGGYVCSEHWLFDYCLIGFVEPCTTIEVIETTWENSDDIKTYVKALKLSKVQELTASQNAVLLVGRPRQGTMSYWWKAQQRLALLVNGAMTSLTLEHLYPSQQEMMCADFLKSPEAASFGLPTLDRLILPPGKTMRDIDIVGLCNDGKQLFAQVTYGDLDRFPWKIDSLRKFRYGEQSHRILFCNCIEKTRQGDVTVFPISRVFDVMTNTELGQQWLHLAVTGQEKC